MKCLVMGGGGFIGSHICDMLVNEGHTVTVFEKKGIDKINLLHLGSRINWCEGDFFNPEDFSPVVEGMDIIFHLICTTQPKRSNENPVYDVTSNVVPTLHLLHAAHNAGVKKIIFPSSGGTVYGIPMQVPISENHATEPICSYGIHKNMIEKYLALFHRLHGLDYAVMRISNAFGKRQPLTEDQGAVTVFLYKALRGEPIEIWGDGSVVRDYLYVSDIARVALRLMSPDLPEKIFNIGSGTGLSLNDIIYGIREVTGLEIDVRYTASRPFDVPVNILDNTRARKLLGWKPEVDLKTGIKYTMEYINSKLNKV